MRSATTTVRGVVEVCRAVPLAAAVGAAERTISRPIAPLVLELSSPSAPGWWEKTQVSGE